MDRNSPAINEQQHPRHKKAVSRGRACQQHRVLRQEGSKGKNHPHKTSHPPAIPAIKVVTPENSRVVLQVPKKGQVAPVRLRKHNEKAIRG